MRMFFALAVVALLGTAPQKAPPEDVAFERDVVYGKAAGVELTLNLARPKDQEGPLPCVVVISRRTVRK